MRLSTMNCPSPALLRILGAALACGAALSPALGWAGAKLTFACPYVEQDLGTTEPLTFKGATGLVATKKYKVVAGALTPTSAASDFNVTQVKFPGFLTGSPPVWYNGSWGSSPTVKATVQVLSPDNEDYAKVPVSFYQQGSGTSSLLINTDYLYLYGVADDPDWSTLWELTTGEDLDFLDAEALYAADLDGDGTDELFADFDGTVTVYAFDGTAWTPWWTVGSDYAHWAVGDFEGVGSQDVLSWNDTCGVSDPPALWEVSDADGAIPVSLAGSTGCDYLTGGHDMLVGDFSGDGMDEIIGTNHTWTTKYEYKSGALAWGWSNYGDTSNPIYAHYDQLTVADVDHDGKDDLVPGGGAAGPAGYWSWVGGPLASSSWKWTHAKGAPLTYSSEHYAVGDYNGDGQDDLLRDGDTVTIFTWDASTSKFKEIWDSKDCLDSACTTSNNGYLSDFRIDDADYPGMSGAWYLPVQATEASVDPRTALMAVRQRCDGDRGGLYQLN